MKLSCLLPLALALALVVAGCGRSEPGHVHTAAHVHTAPHGGTLVELGEHAYALELVHDAAAGTLTAYVLDGHAENFVRIKAATLDAFITLGIDKRPLTFKAVANSATGETVGDTSQFDAQAEWLKGATALEGTISALEIRGNRFTGVAFRLSAPAAK